jgi:hypothetical protein
MTDTGEVESVRPAATSRGSQQGVRGGPWKRSAEALGQPMNDIVKKHVLLP